MENTQGLKNFAINIKPIMDKIRDRRNNGNAKPAKLDYHEQQTILEFYIETINFLAEVK